jgi:Cu/Ag efflux protein CusF
MLNRIILCAALAFTSLAGTAQTTTTVPAEAQQDLSEGEVTRWDARTGKITLRHGELKNLGMPGMTMVFTLQPPAQIGGIQVGDKVRFRAERVNGAFVVTRIEAAR